MTQLALDLAAPATVLVRWAHCSPTWPARADTPCVRGALTDGVRADLELDALRTQLAAVTQRAEAAAEGESAEVTALRARVATLETALRDLAASRRDDQWCGDCGARWKTEHPDGCYVGAALRALDAEVSRG